MPTRRKSSSMRKQNVASKSKTWLWIALGLGASWLAILQPTGRDVVVGFLGWGGLFLGPFMAMTGLLRIRMSSQRQATAWRNRFIIATPLISILASAPTLGPDGASTGGGLLGDFLPMLLSSIIGDVSFWLCSGMAFFAIYWVLGRPILRREILDDLGVKEMIDDAFGDIDGSADLADGRDGGGAGPHTSEPASKVKEIEKNAREEERNVGTSESNEVENRKGQEATNEHPPSRGPRALRDPRSTGGAILNEEATYLPLADPEPDLPLGLEMFGELQSELSREQVTSDSLSKLTKIIVDTVRALQKIELRPIADPVVGMSNIRFEFEPNKQHSKSLQTIEKLTKDLSVATNREQVRVNISSSVVIELSLYEDEREFVPILPLLHEVADVDLDAAPQYLIGRNQERAPYQLDSGSSIHMLVAGSTGGGKSVLLHSIIWGLVFRYPPSRVRLILYDRKMEEFAHYRSLPHLWQPVVTNEDGFHRMLENASAELERRKQARAIDPDATFTWLIIVMDEFRGMANEEFIAFISEARSLQIRVILGTQRANKESIHTTVKQNLGTNIALKVRNFRESDLIIGESGAQDLLMYGDCLVDSSKGLDRVQVGFVDKRNLMELREGIT